MTSLENLRYRDSGKATCYTIDFNRHARKTGWNEQALSRQYYKGLPDRLKDEIARLGKPSSLKALQDLVATLDQRYWERQTEINRDKKSASASTSNNKLTSSDKSSAGQQSSSGNKQDNRQQQGKKDQKKLASSSTPATPSSSDKTPLRTYSAWTVNSSLRKGNIAWTTSCVSGVVNWGTLSTTALPSPKPRVEQPLPPLLLHLQPLAAREKGEQPFDITAGGLR